MENKIIYLSKSPAMLRTISVTHEDYIKSILAMNDYQLAVMTSGIPFLNIPPDNVAELKDCYNSILIVLDKWSRDIYRDLCNVPGQMKSGSLYIKSVVQLANKDIELLKEKYSPLLYSDLKNYIKMMKQRAEDMSKQVNLLLTKLSHFRLADMKTISEKFNFLILTLKEDTSVDLKKIDDLQKDVDKLHGQIVEEALAIGGLVIIGTLMIGVVTVAGFTTGGTGAVAVGAYFAIPAIAGGVYIALSAIEIVSQKEMIDKKLNLMSDYEADICVMQTTADQFSGFVNQAEALQTSLSTIATAWDEISNEFGKLEEQLDSANDSLGTHQWQQMQDELEKVGDSCDELSKSANMVDISEIKVNTANIEIGMDEKQIEAAMEKAEYIPYRDYVLAM